MLQRMHSGWLAGIGAVLLILAMSGVAAAASVASDTTTTDGSGATDPADVSPALLAFQDLNGDGIDDHCETGVVAAPDAVTAALAAVDTNGDGTVSVSEAAHSDWIGGQNCNHGGYVSGVARASTDTCDQADTQQPTTVESDNDGTDKSRDGSNGQGSDESTEDSNVGGTNASTGLTTVAPTVPTCTTPTAPADTTTTAPADCPIVVAPVTPPVVDTAPNAHGAAVSSVAQSTAVGGKNCNHGGAVSEAAHALKLDQAAKHAAKSAKHHGKGQGGQH